MKAVAVHEHGGPENLAYHTDYPDPTPGPGDVILRVKACSLNYHDIFTRNGMPGIKLSLPVVPGLDVAGEIAEVGPDVTDWKVGDRVLAGIGSGGLREQVAIDAAKLFKVPEGVDLVEASALLMTYGTMIHALKDRGDIKPGDTVLVLGAAGGVGAGQGPWRARGRGGLQR